MYLNKINMKENMQKRFVKEKALLMIFLIVTLSFTIANFEEVKADGNVCCEYTSSGDTCVYTDEDNCDGGNAVSTSCEQTSYCEVGVCVSSEGKCSDGVAKTTCESLDYEWHEGSSLDYDVCQKECCVIAEYQCSYTTEDHCGYLIEDLEDIELDWRDVDSEADCSNICRSSDKGCCVTSDSCSYTTYGLCEDPDIDLNTGTGFYEEEYCADLGACACVSHDTKRCVDEDVYWFDSCGNQEDVAEDCDYLSSTWCNYDEEEDDYICDDINCDETFDGVYTIDGVETQRNPHDERIGGEREHGESWCLYESPAGGWFDRPGSQHYRSFCYFGEEIIEPCVDYRESVCIQYPYTTTNNYTLMNPFEEWGLTLGDDYSSTISEAGSACIDNGIYQNLINANVTTVPKGSSLSSESTDEEGTCSSGNQECVVTFGKDSRFGEWHCYDNCYCLTPEWADQAAGFCATQGDCGAKYNLAEEFVGDGFYITKSHGYAGGFDDDSGEVEHNKTLIGYDLNCVETWSVPGENSDPECTKYCKDGESENCYFIDEMREEVQLELKDEYGVYGGLVGFSQSMGEYIATEQSPGLSTVGAIAIGAGAGLVAGLAFSAVTATVAVGVAGAGAVLVGTGTIFAAGISNLIPYVAGVGSVLGPIGWVVAGVIIVIAVIVTLIVGGGEAIEITVSSHCEAWQAPSGLDYCELCDVAVSDGGLAIDNSEGDILRGWECTEYKCNSLGQTCEYIEENVGTERAMCISVATNDVNHPVIEDAYLLGNYKNLDVEFVKDDYLKVNEKIAPYTFFEFGIELDEVGQCKIEYESLHETYEEMDLYFPDSYYDYVHNQSWILTPNEVYNFYVRCQDHNANYNIDAFVIQVETTGGDDITPPSIDATSVNNGAFIASGVNETDVSLFMDEPANCKWSFSDADYSLMEYYMSCSGIPETASSLFENECTALLNVSYGNNYYFFACEDAAGNANTENHAFTLVGTDPLGLDYASPNGTIYYDYTTISAGTSGGAYGDGKAVCSYDGIEFFTTNTSVHSQNLEDLEAGDYNYNIVCSDIAGNSNSTEISFTIAVDSDAPELSGLYLIDTTLYYELNEDATCEYYFEEFDYGEGTSVAGSFTLTELSSYYLICEDVFGNQGEFEIRV